MADEDGTEIQAATAKVVQEEREEDIADTVSITDDKASLVEAGGILSREEVNTSTNVAPYPAVVPTTSTNPLAWVCAIITRQASPATAVQPAFSKSAVHNHSVVTNAITLHLQVGHRPTRNFQGVCLNRTRRNL